MEYGVELRRIRNKEGLTQESLAEMVGVDRVVVNKIENGNRNPSEKLFVRLLQSMGYDLVKKIVKNKRNKT